MLQRDRIKRALRSLPAAYERFLRLLALLGGCVIVIVMLLTVKEAGFRYLLNKPAGWTYEIVEYSMVAFVFLVIAYALAAEKHIRVELVVSHLSPRTQAILEIITSVIALTVFILITWKSWEIAWEYYQHGTTSASSYKMPLFPSKVLVPIGSFLLSLEFIIKIVRRIGFLRRQDLGVGEGIKKEK